MDGSGAEIGITNYEAIKPNLRIGKVECLIPDESSSMRSHYGTWGTTLIQLGKGLDWKLCLTGTPAPNDRIEFANHAVFLDQFPTVNSFLARYFVNRGETGERWELKPHALKAFYTSLSHWCIFLENPATYGWKDNVADLPPINIHVHDVPMTDEQSSLVAAKTGRLFAAAGAGGIVGRASLSQIGKGYYKGKKVATNKPAFIKSLVESWPEESTIIWCIYNREQEDMARLFPDAANISGDTPQEEREQLIDDFKAGRNRVLISKGKLLGFGINLQVCTRMIFSGLVDSWELFHQCVKRANRYRATRPLNVHIPVTDAERPMVETIFAKAGRIQRDTVEQERLFRELGYVGAGMSELPPVGGSA